MGRWTACRRLLHLASSATPKSLFSSPISNRADLQRYRRCISTSGFRFFCSRTLSSIPSSNAAFEDEFDYLAAADFERGYGLPVDSKEDGDEAGKIPVKAFFLSTSINLKSLQAENVRNMIPPASRIYNYIALRFRDEPSHHGTCHDDDCFRYMVVFQYGSTVLFNIEDDEVDSYLNLVRRHASGLLAESRKDGNAELLGLCYFRYVSEMFPLLAFRNIFPNACSTLQPFFKHRKVDVLFIIWSL